MSIIRKVHPTDIKLLKHIYGIIRGLNRIEYDDLSFDTFLECRDGVFIYIDKCYEFSEYPVIDGVIACRRVYDDLSITEGIKVYRRPNTIIYMIEGLNIIECKDPNKYKKIMNALIDTCVIDKNDAHMIIYVSSNTKYISDINLVTALKECGFIESSYNDRIFTLIKPPKTYINESN